MGAWLPPVSNRLLLHGFYVGGYIVEIRSANRDRLHFAFAFGDDLFDIGLAHPLNRGICQWLDVDFEYFGHAWIALPIGAVARLALRAVNRLPGCRIGGTSRPA